MGLSPCIHCTRKHMLPATPAIAATMHIGCRKVHLPLCGPCFKDWRSKVAIPKHVLVVYIPHERI